MKRKIKKIISFLLNPRFVLCFAVAWFITNGWSYVMFALGTILGIDWMLIVSGAYLAFLWLPISPEKLVTFGIAIALLKKFFPNDTKTLGVLKRMRAVTLEKWNGWKQKRKEKKQQKNP